MTKRMNVLGALAVVLAVASIANATGVTLIPTLSGHTSSTGQAITSDGRYVVGTSGGALGYVFDTTTGNTVGITTPYPRTSTVASGVGYRTVGGVDQLLVHGVYSTQLTSVWALDLSSQPTTGNWSTTSFWGMTGETTGLGSGNYNTLASLGLGQDLAYTTSKQGTTTAKAKVLVFGRLIGSTNTMSNIATTAAMGGTTSPSATGIVAYSQSGQAWTGVYGNTSGTIQGTGPNGPYAIAADGSRAFGFHQGTQPFAVDLNSSGTFGTEYAMPVLAGTTSTSTAYGSSVDGQYAVGKCYGDFGNGNEDRAVLWDLTDTGNITVMDLNQWAIDNNAMGGFTVLSRATSVGINGQGQFVITGNGTYGGATRAFVLTIPEPATLIFMALGGLFLRRRR